MWKCGNVFFVKIAPCMCAHPLTPAVNELPLGGLYDGVAPRRPALLRLCVVAEDLQEEVVGLGNVLGAVEHELEVPGIKGRKKRKV